MAKGRIIKATGGFYYVKTDSGVVECRARGKFRLEKVTPLVGDIVEISENTDGSGYVTGIMERKNFLVRPPVANIDYLYIVCSAAPPVTDTLFIDKMCVSAEICGIKPVIVINKSDIDKGENIAEIYRAVGIPVIHTSATESGGETELIKSFHSGITVFAGNSGVGKSSLLSNIIDDREIEIGSISAKIGRGKQTTRTCRLFTLDDSRGVYIADTPGFSSFDNRVIETIDAENLELYFPELEQFLGKCRFTGCAHISEPDCAVIAAVREGIIPQSRFESYAEIYKQLMQSKEYR